MHADIKADAKDNLYAVYVGNPKGTVNSALYISAYDPKLNVWGSGVMLAMHDMDTYEASIRNKWDDTTTEAAYLYGLGRADLEKLYGSETVAALAAYDTPALEYQLGDAGTFNFTGLQTLAGANGELVVITAAPRGR